MEFRYDQIKVETTPNGITVTIPRRVGKEIVLELEGQDGPALVTEMLQALEPHFAVSQGAGKPMPALMTVTRFDWQGGVSPDGSKTVHLTLRPTATPGIHFIMPADQARALGKALIDLGTSAETPGSKN